jgi:hypothetical protein
MSNTSSLYSVAHSHRHGVDVHHVRAFEAPSIEEVVEALKLDYEPACEDESVEIAEVNEASIPLIGRPVGDPAAVIATPDIHGEDATYTREDWQIAAGSGDTQMGYWDWVSSRRESEEG